MISKNLSSTLKKIKANKLIFILTIIICLAFIWSTVSITTSYELRIMGKVDAMNTLVQQSTVNLTGDFTEKPEALSGILQNQKQLKEYNAQVAKLMLTALLLLFIIYIGFHSIKWYLLHQISKKRKDTFLKILLNFFTINLIWLAVSIALFVLWAKLAIANRLSTITIINPLIITIIFALLFIVLGYFILVSYTQLPKKGFFKLAFTESIRKLTFITTYLIILASIIISSLILALCYWISPFLFLFIFIIGFTPLISFLKLFAIESAN